MDREVRIREAHNGYISIKEEETMDKPSVIQQATDEVVEAYKAIQEKTGLSPRDAFCLLPTILQRATMLPSLSVPVPLPLPDIPLQPVPEIRLVLRDTLRPVQGWELHEDSLHHLKGMRGAVELFVTQIRQLPPAAPAGQDAERE